MFHGLSVQAAPPVILITNLPPFGSTNYLSGKVLADNSATQAVAVFIYVPGYGWVTKPNCAQPLTKIQPDGSWSANVTTGGGDTSATRFAALLVATNFNEACALGLANLPTNLYAQALASAFVTRPSPGPRWIQFSGYDWSVKSTPGLAGPGPNYFSNSPSNVWIDVQGSLHLRITNRTNQWQCAEIISARTFGYGNYRFEVGSPVAALDPNATLGLFTYSDDPAYADREIDVECGRWENPADTNNAQFVVQPYPPTNHLTRYRVPTGAADSTHLFVWRTNGISFESMVGSYSPSLTSSNVLRQWNFTNASAVPQTGDENVHLNLWLVKGNAPAEGQEVEVVIKSFQFVPLGPPPRVNILGATYSATGQFRFNLTTWPDYWYQVQSSTDLVAWQNFPAFSATNDVMLFQDTNPPAATARYYRVVTLP